MGCFKWILESLIWPESNQTVMQAAVKNVIKRFCERFCGSWNLYGMFLLQRIPRLEQAHSKQPMAGGISKADSDFEGVAI